MSSKETTLPDGYFTLPEALAWICKRDASEIARIRDPLAQHTAVVAMFKWAPRAELTPEQFKAMRAGTYEPQVSLPPGCVMAPAEALEYLTAAARNGVVRVSGRRVGHIEATAVPTTTWADTRWQIGDSSIGLHSRITGELLWEDLQFRMADVICGWPREGRSQTVQGSGSVGSPPRKDVPIRTRVPEPELRAWYEQRVRDQGELKNIPSEKDDWAAVREQFPHRVTRDRIRALRDELAPVAWKQQGRRPRD